MSKEKKNMVLPKLRFPEFKANWEEKLVEDFFDVGSSKRVLEEDWTNKGVPFYRTRELVSLSKNEPFSNEIFISEDLFVELTEKYGMPSEGDFLISGVGTLGISYQVKRGDKFYFKDGNVIWFKLKSGIVSDFFKYCFQSDIIQKQIFGQAAISTVGTYTIQNAKKTKFFFSGNPEEQQKIASCLSSLDDLITAYTQKLDALKAHKKGLIQQLFPVEGEKVPKLRFAEFKDSGEWVENTIGNFIESYKGGAPLTPSDFVTYSEFEVIPKKAINEGIWLRLDLNNPTYCTEYFYNNNPQSIVDSSYLITTLRDLVPSGPSIGYIVKYQGKKKYILAQGVYGLKLKETLIPEFLIHFSNTSIYRKLVNAAMVGSTQVHIRNSEFLKLPIKTPCFKEQQKIADSLSSLDELITKQAEKIEQLKNHKKGLMQGLFPSLNSNDNG